jgi:hypothetical protein
LGFWFKIAFSPREKRGYAEAGAAQPSFSSLGWLIEEQHGALHKSAYRGVK